MSHQDPIFTLASLDPEVEEPGYWSRFEQDTLRRASHELARRSSLAQVTMGQVMMSWSRMVVPSALAAATMAAVLLAQGPTSAAPAPAVLSAGFLFEISTDPVPGGHSQPGDEFIFVEMEQW